MIHIGAASSLRAAGVDVNAVKTAVFSTVAKSTTALVGGHIDTVAAFWRSGIGPQGMAKQTARGGRERRAIAFGETASLRVRSKAPLRRQWNGHPTGAA